MGEPRRDLEIQVLYRIYYKRGVNKSAAPITHYLRELHMCDTICCVPPKIGTTEGLSSHFIKSLYFPRKTLFCRSVIGQMLQFPHEVALVFELPVDRGEAHVGHLVDLAQMLHDLLADLLGGDFLLVEIAQSRLDAID